MRREVYGRGPLCGQCLRAVCPCISIADSPTCLDTEQLVAAALCLISLSQFLLSNFASQDTRYRHTKHLLFVLCSICSLVDSMLSLILICCLVNRFPDRVGVGVL